MNSGPGRVVCVAAGNSGNENIHASATVAAGTDIVLTIQQPPADNPGFVELYYPGPDRFNVTVTKPNGSVIGPFAYDPGLYNNLTPSSAYSPTPAPGFTRRENRKAISHRLRRFHRCWLS